jgi:RimK-like ATP-grasp domain
MILVIGEADEEHVRHVTDRLEERGARYFQFDYRLFPTSADVTIEFDQAGKFRRALNCQGRKIDLSEVCAVWHRARERPTPPAHVREDQAWWVSESCLRFLAQLYECLDCLWVPERRSLERVLHGREDTDRPAYKDWSPYLWRSQTASPENKLHQLSVAGRVGFSVPRTLVTNNPDKFLDFYEACDGELISKRAVDLKPLVGDDVARVFTNVVRRRDAANADAVRFGAVVFQENVPKRVELRVNVVGVQVFAAEIKSQESVRQATDWRHTPQYAQPRVYENHKLPPTVEACCVRVVEALGLCFGAIDLIQKPDGEYVFLEVNMNGQWAYIEDMLGLPISHAIADLLVQGHV